LLSFLHLTQNYIEILNIFVIKTSRHTACHLITDVTELFMPLALFALTISAFAIGTTEFVIVGLVPTIAQQLTISLPSAGMLVSIYALGVAIGAPVLTALTGSLPRKKLLVALMVLFGGEFTGMAGTRVYDTYCRPSADGAGSRRILLDWFHYRDKSGAKRKSSFRHRYYVRWLNGGTGHGRAAGYVYRPALWLA
jgi:hypothetical protein